MVSGTISLPSRGTFHHSLTVLIHYRSPCPSRLTQWSGQIHTRFHEPRATREQNPTPRMRNQLPDSHGLRPGIPTCSPHTHKQRSKQRQSFNDFVPQPRLRNPCRVSHANGLANTRYRSPLHTDYLTKGGTKMFHFPPYQHTPIKTSVRANHTQLWSGYPIRKPPDQRTLANSPRLSPATTSFIGTRCQGIHQTLKNKKQTNKQKNTNHPKVVNEQDSHKKSITKTLTSTLQKTNNQPKKPQKTKRPSRVNEPNKQTPHQKPVPSLIVPIPDSPQNQTQKASALGESVSLFHLR